MTTDAQMNTVSYLLELKNERERKIQNKEKDSVSMTKNYSFIRYTPICINV